MSDMKKIEGDELKKWLELFSEAARLAVEINSTMKYAVFFEVSGHIQTGRVSIRESKSRYNEEVASSEFGIAFQAEYAWKLANVEKMQRIVDILRDTLRDGDVPMDKLDKTATEVWEYAF